VGQRTKYVADGFVDKHKAHLVAKGLIWTYAGTQENIDINIKTKMQKE